MGQEGCITSGCFRGNMFPCFSQLPEAAGIPWPVAPDHSDHCFRCHMSSDSVLLPPSNTLVITLVPAQIIRDDLLISIS